MLRQKEILAAGIVRDIAFIDSGRADLYLFNLDHKKVKYQVLDSHRCNDGSVILRIVQQYNRSSLIQLYE